VTPQSHFMILAALAPSRELDLRKLLASMNCCPGVADPQNSVVPFGQFDRLHFARFLILRDQTLNDITVYDVTQADLPMHLAFLGDCDGSSDSFLRELVEQATDGLRLIFSHCREFSADYDLLRWMKEHEQPPATVYINWLGRTVRQIREEHALRNALESYLDCNAETFTEKKPQQIENQFREFVKTEQRAGRLVLTPIEATPLGWQLRNFLHCIAVPLVLLLLFLVLLLYLPIFIWQLRRRECSDPEIAPRPNAVHAEHLAELEDRGVTNQFSALGSLKPGRFRRWTLIAGLLILNYTTRHVYNRGWLARVNTIHFARWVFLDNKSRLFFASNYDGSLESYMDDFINKVGWGLNLVFSNGVGYPRTNWLVKDGAKDEQKFKYFIRRHQLPTEVWYNANPGLTTFDQERNTLIREGLQRSFRSDAEIRAWLNLF
jgi:hypothetical protein